MPHISGWLFDTCSPPWLKVRFMTGSICDIFFFYITCDIFCTVPTVVTGAYLSGPVCIIFMFIPLHIVRFKFFVYWSLPSLCTLYVYVTARQNKLHSSNKFKWKWLLSLSRTAAGVRKYGFRFPERELNWIKPSKSNWKFSFFIHTTNGYFLSAGKDGNK